MNSRIDELKKKLLNDTATFAEASEYIYLRFNPKAEDAVIEAPKPLEENTASIAQSVSGDADAETETPASTPTLETAPEISDEIAGNAQVQSRE